MVDLSQHLNELKWHWGSAYMVFHPEPDVWMAQRRDDYRTLRDQTPTGLRDRIRADYAARPVSRRIEADRPETPGCRFRPEG
jgi:hypothetical protein